MVEEILVKDNLTPEMIRAGKELIDALDRRTWPVVSAFWLFNSEANRWRLIVASPEVDRQGPLHCYEVVNETLSELGDIGLAPHDISVASPNAKFPKLFTAEWGPESGRIGVRVSRAGIQGRYVEDAFIYRAGQMEAQTKTT